VSEGDPSSSELRELTVPAELKPQRVDAFLRERLAISRTQLSSLFESGGVRVNGRLAKKGQIVEAGQRIRLRSVPSGASLVADLDLPLSVLHLDDAFLFVDKPAGYPSHPLRPGERGTLANAIAARFPECLLASDEPREAGLCHRLDVGTSGVVLVARTPEAWKFARELFGRQEVDKRYWALVTGPLADEGEVDLPLRHAPKHPERVEAAAGDPRARPARSAFRVLAREGTHSLVEVRIFTGVMHQVRAHLAAIGAPIAGDPLYGGRPQRSLARPFLHARSLALKHPREGEHLLVHSPLPTELASTLAQLRISNPG